MAGITLDGVSKVFAGGVQAVDNVSLEIGDGEFMVLVGPSGMWQDDDPAHGGRARGGHRRRDRNRRPRRHRPGAQGSRHRDGVPERDGDRPAEQEAAGVDTGHQVGTGGEAISASASVTTASPRASASTGVRSLNWIPGSGKSATSRISDAMTAATARRRSLLQLPTVHVPARTPSRRIAAHGVHLLRRQQGALLTVQRQRRHVGPQDGRALAEQPGQSPSGSAVTASAPMMPSICSLA